MQLKGAFSGCNWCGGNGCLQCDDERRKAEERAMQPILTFKREDLDDPTLGPRIKDAIGAQALRKAFGPDGGGIAEVERNCAIVSLVQVVRKTMQESEQSEE